MIGKLLELEWNVRGVTFFPNLVRIPLDYFLYYDRWMKHTRSGVLKRYAGKRRHSTFFAQSNLMYNAYASKLRNNLSPKTRNPFVSYTFRRISPGLFETLSNPPKITLIVNYILLICNWIMNLVYRGDSTLHSRKHKSNNLDLNGHPLNYS